MFARIHDEGHSIGLHTYSHKFKLVYRNEDSFIKEMLQCRDMVREITGTSPDIIRFPGGSRGRLTKAYLDRLHSYNFKVYDWNMEMGDGLKPRVCPDRIYIQATKGSEKLSTVMLLLHCGYMHKNTCKALPGIIKYYKERGYEFKPITEGTPELYFPITKNNRRFISELCGILYRLQYKSYIVPSGALNLQQDVRESRMY